jgi:2-keto-3-deoxy-L-rhamnonate aldolase RhmA
MYEACDKGEQMLKLMYITNNPNVARIAQEAGVERIMVDMEYIGKDERQEKFGTPQSHYTFEDVQNIRKVLDRAELVVRCNPIHMGVEGYPDSDLETKRILDLGADIIMLPYFKSPEEVRKHIDYVNGRAKVYLLVETSQAVDHLDEILEIPGIDEIHIGLNDLSICYGKKFLFEVLADGTVEKICRKISEKGIPYGIGGVGAPDGKNRAVDCKIPAEMLIREYHRLQSSSVILSRAFCNTARIADLEEIRNIFETGVRNIRAVEQECVDSKVDYNANRALLQHRVEGIAAGI